MKNRAGFSLVELMVAVAILGILAGLVAPGIVRYLNARGVTDAATQVYLDMQRIRSRCITQRRTANFTFTTGADSTYSVRVTNPSDAQFQDYPATPLSDFRGDVDLVTPGPDGVASAANISFNIQGSCPVAGAVFITNVGNSAWYRVRTTLAGGISLHVWDATSNTWIVY